ncbi:hypothetical protein ACOME3_009390 [Neoechinorhynchus agilis]
MQVPAKRDCLHLSPNGKTDTPMMVNDVPALYNDEYLRQIIDEQKQIIADGTHKMISKRPNVRPEHDEPQVSEEDNCTKLELNKTKNRSSAKNINDK